jgi:tetratricopeptide (TPR) repeat protein
MHPRITPAQATKPPLLVARTPAPVSAPVAAISLTGADGSGLELVSLQARAVIEDPLAFTELRLVFKNPESRVREGRFRITLPSGATVSRFAMRIGERMQEGEVVEQQAARVAYEDFLHRRQDPALLESEAGNEFSARVFPIPANSTKELILSYSQELTRRDEAYTLPLRGLPKLGTLSIRALVKSERADGGKPASSLGGQRAQTEVVQVDKHDFMPDVDFTVAHRGNASRLGLRHDNLVAARIVPLSDSGERDAVSSLYVLIDTSASRALGLAEQVSATENLLASLAGDTQLTIATFDQTVTPIYSGRVSGLGESLRKGVLAQRALGASDLDSALTWLSSTLAKQQHKRVLLVSDGVATAGQITADALRTRVKALGQVGVERLDVLAVGGIRDDVMLSRLVTAGLARDGIVLDATRPVDVLSQKLTRATRSGLKLEIDGAGWVWPNVLNGVQPGDEFIVYADLPVGKPFGVKVAGKPLALAGALASVERPLLERAWIKARIGRLSEQRDNVVGSDRDLAEALKKQAIELSTQYRVLSPYTSLLVLETEQDYARFGIERRALADILTVDASGIALLHRAEIATPVNQIAVEARDEQPTADKPSIRPPPPPSPSDMQNQSLQKSAAAPERRMEQEAPMASPVEADALGRAGPGQGGAGQAASAAASSGAARGAPAAEPQPSRAPAAPAPAARDDAREEQVMADVPARRRPVQATAEPRAEAKKKDDVAPVEGELKQVLDLLRAGKKQPALAHALAWRERDPGDVLALVALGEAWEALGDLVSAARAYGSIIDLFPGRADMRRFAGERLERVRTNAALALAVDTYTKAVEQRPDHPASHRLLGFGLLKQGRAHQAFEAILLGVKRSYPSGRFRGVERILSEDLGLMAAAWIKKEPARADEIRTRTRAAGAEVEDGPSIRFVLNWETDANDVDFHIHDGKGGHAYYSSPHLPAGGDLYADVTTGYGPECFTIRGAAAERAYPYRLQAHYYSKGPMGYGMGKLEVIDHDGRGGFRFEERPFVVMQDGAFVSLGTVHGPAQLVAK